MPDSNILEKALSLVLGMVFGLLAAVWWLVKGVVLIIRRIVIDMLKNLYARIIAALVGLALIALGFSSLAQLH